MRSRGVLFVALVYTIIAGAMGAIAFWHNPATLVAVIVLMLVAIPGLAWLLRVTR